MTAVFRRELGSLYGGFIGYIFAFLFLVFGGIVTMTMCIQASYAQFEYVLSSVRIVYIVGIPILTMRSVSEERRQRTDLLLYSLPVSMLKVAMGKFAAMLTALLVPVLILCVYPLVLSAYGAVNLRAAYAGFLAFFLLGASLISVGMFVSSLTESQAIAAAVTFIVILINYFLPDLVSYFPAAVSGFVSELCLFTHYDGFYDQIFDVRAVILYLSVTAVFLFLTVQVLEKRRWS